MKRSDIPKRTDVILAAGTLAVAPARHGGGRHVPSAGRGARYRGLRRPDPLRYPQDARKVVP